MVEAMFELSPKYFYQFRKQFRFCLLKDKRKVGIDFGNDMVLALGLHSLAHDGFSNALTDNHNQTLAPCFVESHNSQPKVFLLPCFFTTYALQTSNTDKKKVFEELFEK